jgi:hypothetical protein
MTSRSTKALVDSLSDSVGRIGFAAFVVSALIMIYLWITTMQLWLGWGGAVLALISAPLACLFPFIHWAVEGEAHWRHFAIWAVGILGIAVSMGRGFLPRGGGEDTD